MAKSTTELNILITVTNQAKDAITQAVQQLNAVKQSLDGLGTGQAAGTEQVATALHHVGEEAKKAGEHAAHAEGGIHSLVDGFEKLLNVVKLVSGGFLAFEAVKMVKELADVAARTETLGIVLQTVGKNAGYTSVQLSDADKAVRKLGITADASRQSITQLLQAGLSIDFAKPLARASQDLAVITGVNSSETFKRLIVNIQQLDTLGLRFMGIMVDRERVFAQAAQETGKAISGNLEKTVFANAVLAESAKLTGLYEAAMESAGKQLTSMPRFIENFKDALGTGLQPVYLQLIVGTQHVLDALTHLAESFHEPAINAQLFGDAVEGAEGKMTPLATVVKGVADSLVDLIHWIQHNKDLLVELIRVVRDVIATLLVLSAATRVFALVSAGMIAVRTAMALVTAIGPTAAAAITLFGRAATVAGASVSIAWAPVLLPILAVIAAIGALIWAYDALTGATTQAGHEAAQSADEMVDGFQKALIAQEKLIRANNLAQDQLRRARNNEAANPADKSFIAKAQEAKKVADEAAEAIKHQAEVITKLRESLANSKELSERTDLLELVKEADAASSARVTSLRKETEAQQALSDALKKAGDDYGEYLSGINSKTEEKIGALRQSIEQLGHAKFSDVESGLLNALSQAEKLASNIHSDKELKFLEAAVDSLNKEAGKFGLNFSQPIKGLVTQANSALATYKQNLQAGGAAANNEKKQIDRRTAQLERERLLGEVEDHKMAAARTAEIDKQFFDKGLINLDNYYAHRIAAVEAALKDEEAAQVAFIKGEIARKDAETDPAKKIQIEKEIQSAKNKLRQSANKADAEVQKLQIDALNHRYNLELEVGKIAASINKEQGHEELAIRQEVEDAYQREIQKVRQLGNLEAEQLVQRKFEIDLNKKLSDQRLIQLGRELDLRRSLLDLNEAVLALDLQIGNISTIDHDEKVNDLIRERITLLEAEFDATQRERDAAFADGRNVDGNLKNTKMAQLQKEIVSLITTIKSIGNAIKTSLTDSIASNFEAIITKTKSFKQGMLDIFKDLNSQILKILTKNVAEDLVRGIDGLGKGGGKGPGIFDKLASLVTGQPIKESPEVSKERESAILKENVAAAAKEEKFAATALTQQAILEASKTSGNTQRTAEAAEALVKQYEATALKAANAEAAGLGKVSKAVISGTDVGEAGGPDPVTIEEKQTVTLKKLMALGLSFEKAAGITANIQKESGFDPTAGGDGKQAFGLAQWHPDRQADFKKMFGFDIKKSTSDQQLEFLVAELKNKESAANTALNKTSTAAEAGASFSKNFERPKDVEGEAASRAKLATAIAERNSDLDPLKVQVVSKDGDDGIPESLKKQTKNSPHPAETGYVDPEMASFEGIKSQRGGASGDWQSIAEGKFAGGVKSEAMQGWDDAAVKQTATIKEATKVAEAASQADKVATVAAVADADATRTSTVNLGTLSDAAQTAADALSNMAAAAAGGGRGSPSEAPKPETGVEYQGNPDMAMAGQSRQLIASGGKPKDATNTLDVVQGYSSVLGSAVGSKVGGPIGGAIGTILGKMVSKIDFKKVSDPLKDKIEDGFNDVGSTVEGGGAGIGDFFNSFSGTLKSFFSDMGGSGEGGGGIFGALSSLFGGGGAEGGSEALMAAGFFADGGFVSGPGTGTSDSIPAMLSNGEYVMTAAATRQFLPMLEAMRSGNLSTGLGNLVGSMRVHVPRTPHFAGGGMVDGQQFPTSRSGANTHVTMNIHTPDANSFRRSEDQISSRLADRISKSQRNR